MIVHTTFDMVKLMGRKRVRCLGPCGRMLNRQTTVFQTLNPYNVNKHGDPKLRDEIYAELEIDIRKWKSAREYCRRCQENMEDPDATNT